MNRYRFWMRTYVVGIILLGVLIVLFNYFTDAFNLFKSKNTRVINDLNNNYYISYDNIAVNRFENIYEPIIKQINKIDFLAIGSSRTMLLHHDLLFKDKNITYYNFTNGTAKLGFYGRVIGAYNKYQKPFPKNIILGIDPWIFDSEVKLDTLTNIILKYEKKNNKYIQLFNFEYTCINMRYFYKKVLKSKEKDSIQLENYKRTLSLASIQKDDNDNIVMSPSGDLHYPSKKTNVTTEKVLEYVQNRINKCNNTNYNTKCVQYDFLTNFNELKYIISFLQNKRINVYVFLAPFEPVFYNNIVDNYNFKMHNDKINNFLKDNNIPIIGSYNPSDYNLKSKDFYDAIHPKESAIKVLFKQFREENNRYENE